MSNVLDYNHVAVVRPRAEFQPRSLILRKIGVTIRDTTRGHTGNRILRSPDRGISIVTGRPLYNASPSRRRPSPKVAMIGAPSLGGKEICEVRFDRTIWSVRRALEWLDRHDIVAVAFLEARFTPGEM